MMALHFVADHFVADPGAVGDSAAMSHYMALRAPRGAALNAPPAFMVGAPHGSQVTARTTQRITPGAERETWRRVAHAWRLVLGPVCPSPTAWVPPRRSGTDTAVAG
ncbi:hypothetical protein GCM10010357_04170 [Streptomyces luteireticuli]|uniref:Uncharacterized protein n=1 Tax=Streptomyces luteireticuli TaxID=173858 RepID=A0ABP3I1Z9_9ACTN